MSDTPANIPNLQPHSPDMEEPVNFIQGIHHSEEWRDDHKRLIGEEWKNHDLQHENDAVAAERDKYQQEAEYDEATGLMNKRGFNRVFKELVNSENRNEMALIIIDLDGFKSINDTEGHDKGDTVLRRIAEGLKRTLRKGDMVFRIGGDEFAILSPEFRRKKNIHVDENNHEDEFTRDEMAQQKAHRIRFATELAGKMESVIASASVGFAFFEQVDNEQTMFSRADQDMYADKRQGKERRLERLRQL